VYVPVVSEAPHDIPYMKFVSTEVITTTVTPTTDGLWATYEVVNIGTAPTTIDDIVIGAACFQGAQVHTAEHRFDNPVIAPNGGSHRGSLHFESHIVGVNGDWELYFGIPAKEYGGGFIDEARLPFKVELGPTADVHHLNG
jgi:hypothetical protein